MILFPKWFTFILSRTISHSMDTLMLLYRVSYQICLTSEIELKFFLEYWFITQTLFIILVFNTSDWGDPQCINDTNKDNVFVPGNPSYFGPNSVCLNSSNPVQTCRYRSYRTEAGDGEYELNIEWFRIMVARLLFVLIFEVAYFWYIIFANYNRKDMHIF